MEVASDSKQQEKPVLYLKRKEKMKNPQYTITLGSPERTQLIGECVRKCVTGRGMLMRDSQT